MFYFSAVQAFVNVNGFGVTRQLAERRPERLLLSTSYQAAQQQNA
jgi:hypothetical protein